MLNRMKKTNNKGFTIIEVMIVLAIAGLILLIVFLAVPALQRNARNTTRKNDIASLGSAITEYVNNQNGTLPTTAANFTGNWKPGFYTAAEVTFTANAAATTIADPANTSKISVGTFSTCNATGTASTTANATTKSIAMVYDVETGSGMQEECVTAQ
jgi:prepilin-type N-terminal cleavage/methylation domain-containing protein